MNTLVEKKVTNYIAGFGESELASRTAVEIPFIAGKRKEAFRAYGKIPTPTVRDEEWRRTDPSLFPFGNLKSLEALQPKKQTSNSAWDEHFDVVITVDDAGYSITDRSGVLKDKIVVTSLREAAEKHSDLVRAHLQSNPARKYDLLNAAFWNVGFFIHVPKKVVLERGILFRYAHQADGRIVLPRLLVVMGEQSEATIVEQMVSPDSIRFMSLASREFYVDRAAQLRVVLLQEWGVQTYNLAEDWARVQRDAKVDWITLTLGGAISKMMVGSDVCAPNANAYLSGLFFADKQQHVDQRSLQLHSSPDTYSNLLYKGAVKDQAHSIYQGIINAKPGAIRVDAYQMNNNLILNEGARADSLPGLEIDADDLKCSHGSTVGTLDPDQIFYLRSRGLSEAEARRLVVTAFFEAVISKVPYAFIQEHVRNSISEKM